MNGQIIKIISNLYTVKSNDLLIGCHARGVFRKKGITPLVGDKVIIDPKNNIITEILERKNELKRPVIANVDIALIVTSVKEPNLDLILLDKLITNITYNNIEPVIVFTKLDLISDESKDSIDSLREYYEIIGIKVFYNDEITEIKKYIKDKLVVLAGQSGAGKSSLVNKMDSKYNIETNEISKSLGRGKHTTRHVELYDIDGSLVADTPGFSKLDLSTITKEELKNTFIEFNNYECKFKNCMHNKEKECSVKDAVENKKILETRYNNYIKFLEEIE